MLLATVLVATVAILGVKADFNSLYINSSHVIPSLLDANLEDLQRGLRDGAFTSLELTRAYIQRIGEVNKVLRAVNEINPEAEDIAAELDKERSAGCIRGPLHGLPILLKDIIATKDALNNTAGSFVLLGAKVPSDSTVVSKLRSAGVIILGKANLSQWANCRSSSATDGWSAYGGQTKGAYCENQTPSGSSSGSAVASSIGLAFASLGTETEGSILSPSSINNVVGIKPTVGLTSRTLVIPISEHEDTVGPIARTVKDAAYVLQAIAGKDPADKYTLAQPFETPPDYVAAAGNILALSKARLGVPRNMAFQNLLPDNTVLDAFEAALDIMEAAGATIVDNTNITDGARRAFTESDDQRTVLATDFVTNLPHLYLSKLTTNPLNLVSLADVRKFTQDEPLEEYPDRDTDLWDFALRLGINNTSPAFQTSLDNLLRMAGPEGITGVLSNYSLDALVLPTDIAYGFSGILGSPAVTVPMGVYPADAPTTRTSRGGLIETAPNVPFGICFFGAKWSEELLIGLAASYEHLTNARTKVQPYLTPKTEIQDVKGRKPGPDPAA